MNFLVAEVKKMKDKNYYNAFAWKIIVAAEPYNIENVAKLYRQLT